MQGDHGYTPAERFLDLACLRYNPTDAPERRERAREVLAAHPEIVRENLSVAAALGACDAVAESLAGDPEAVGRSAAAPGLR